MNMTEIVQVYVILGVGLNKVPDALCVSAMNAAYSY